MSVISSTGASDHSIQVNNVTPVTPATPVAGGGLASGSSGVSTSSDYGAIFLNRRTLENLGLPPVDQNVENINLKEVSSALAALIEKLSALASLAGLQGARNQLGRAVSSITAFAASAAVVDAKSVALDVAKIALTTGLAALSQTSGGVAIFHEGTATADSSTADIQALLTATNAANLAQQSNLISLQGQLATEQAKVQPDSARVTTLTASIISTQGTIAALTADRTSLSTLLSLSTAKDTAETEYETASNAAQSYYLSAMLSLATAAAQMSKVENNAGVQAPQSDDVTLDAIEELVAGVKDAAQRRALEALLQQIVDAAASLSASGENRPGKGILSDQRTDGSYSTITKGSLTALLALNPASMTLDDFLAAVNAGGSESRLSKAGAALGTLDAATKQQVVADIADFLHRLKAAIDAIATVTDLAAATSNQDPKIVKVSL
jgi:hypothetical protein